MIVIGICGQQSSGKDTVAHYLATKGFSHISTGDLIRAAMVEKGLPLDRDSVREFAAAERAKHGPGFPTSAALPSIKEAGKDVAISGLRNVAEIAALREAFGGAFRLIAVDAPLRVRYERALARDRETDHVSFEKFVEQEQAERNGSAQQIDAIIAMADASVPNAGTEAELHGRVDAYLASIAR